MQSVRPINRWLGSAGWFCSTAWQSGSDNNYGTWTKARPNSEMLMFIPPNQLSEAKMFASRSDQAALTRTFNDSVYLSRKSHALSHDDCGVEIGASRTHRPNLTLKEAQLGNGRSCRRGSQSTFPFLRLSTFLTPVPRNLVRLSIDGCVVRYPR
jgi:hypothetical protein